MVVAGILVFRVIYFLLPLMISAVLVGWHEYALWKKWIRPIVVDPDGPADEPVDRGERTVTPAASTRTGTQSTAKCASSESQQHVPLD